MISATLLGTSLGAFGSGYLNAWYSVLYEYGGARFRVKTKINLPRRERVLVLQPFVKLVVFIVGGTQPDIACEEGATDPRTGRFDATGFHTEIAGLLAASRPIEMRSGTVLSEESGDGIVAVQFNAPG